MDDEFASPGMSLHILGGPYVSVNGARIEIPEGGKRLVVYVALNGGRVVRANAAQTLWGNVEAARASGNLRSAVWRLRSSNMNIIVADGDHLAIRDDVAIDVDSLLDWAEKISSNAPIRGGIIVHGPMLDALHLLPGWYEDWVQDHRDSIRRRILSAMDGLAVSLAGMGDYGGSIDAALVSLGVDPLREAPHRNLIVALLAEGNECEALRAFQNYASINMRELGAPPAEDLRRLIDAARVCRGRVRHQVARSHRSERLAMSAHG